jgi:uncharacterized protein YkwD
MLEAMVARAGVRLAAWLVAIGGAVALAVGPASCPAAARAAGTPAAADTAEPALVAAVIDLTNAERVRAGLAPLAEDPALDAAAQAYARVLASSSCFAHTCGPVPVMSTRLEAACYVAWREVAENIAAGYPTPERVVAGWMGSPGHRANILDPRLADIGVGVVLGVGELRAYWVEDFGTRRRVAVEATPPAPDAGPADDG